MKRCNVTVSVNDEVIARFVLRADANLFAQAMRDADMLSASDTPDAPIIVHDPVMAQEYISY